MKTILLVLQFFHGCCFHQVASISPKHSLTNPPLSGLQYLIVVFCFFSRFSNFLFLFSCLFLSLHLHCHRPRCGPTLPTVQRMGVAGVASAERAGHGQAEGHGHNLMKITQNSETRNANHLSGTWAPTANAGKAGAGVKAIAGDVNLRGLGSSSSSSSNSSSNSSSSSSRSRSSGGGGGDGGSSCSSRGSNISNRGSTSNKSGTGRSKGSRNSRVPLKALTLVLHQC